MRLHRFAGVAVSAVVFLVTWTVSRPAGAQTVEKKYVGAETCKECHEDHWNRFQGSTHGVIANDPQLVNDVVSCEACHGPGSAHAEAGGDPDNPGFATILSFEKADAKDANAACLTCHNGGEQMHWQQSDHARKGLACVRCHSVHEAKSNADVTLLRAKKATDLCVQCHLDKHLALQRTAHMPLREGSMTCADCHNPHGSATPKNLRAQNVNELCLNCHTDKRGPFLWEHAPVRENCTNCHDPHGSNNPQVLAAKTPFLCQNCHISTRHPSTLYDAPDLASNRLFNRSCVNCHSQVHGSNHPSGKFFLR